MPLRYCLSSLYLGRADDVAAVIDAVCPAVRATQGGEIGHHAIHVEKGPGVAAGILGTANDVARIVDGGGETVGSAQGTQIGDGATCGHEAVRIAGHDSVAVDAVCAASRNPDHGHGTFRGRLGCERNGKQDGEAASVRRARSMTRSASSASHWLTLARAGGAMHSCTALG